MKKINFIILIIFVTIFSLQSTYAQVDYIQINGENGSINWTTQLVTATGKVVIDTVSYPNKEQANMMAERGATAIAQRNLLEIVKGIRVVSTTKGKKNNNSVEYLITENDKINTSVAGVLKNAKKVGKTKYENGYASVTMESPLYQGNNSIASAVFRKKSSQATKPPIRREDIYFYVVAKNHKQVLFPKIYDNKGNLAVNFMDYYNKFLNFPTTKAINDADLEKLKNTKYTIIIELKEDKRGNFHSSDSNVDWAKINSELRANKKMQILIRKN